MKKLNCLNCNREFDKEQGHLCPKNRWTWENENVSITLENTDVDIDLTSYEFITPPNEPLPETSSFCTEVLNEISDPSADFSLSTQLTSGVNRQTDSSQVLRSEQSDNCNSSRVGDIHAVPGPSRLSFYYSERSMSEETFESKKYHRAPIIKKPWKCEVCQRVYKNKKNLKQHMKIHYEGKKHRCDDCGKLFSKKFLLKNHARIHTGESPFSCPVCEKRFTTNWNLKLHIAIHGEEKPYKCEICDQSFIRRDRLKRHVMMNHTGE